MTAAAFVASANARALNQTAARNDSIPPADQCRISGGFSRLSTTERPGRVDSVRIEFVTATEEQLPKLPARIVEPVQRRHREA